jgi:lipopolysaccharide heptosyltransferase II
MRLSEREKILIIRLGSVGDVVRTLPAISALRTCYSNARIDWVVQDLSEEIVRSLSTIDTVIVLPRKRWTQMARSPLSYPRLLKEIIGWIFQLRKRKYQTTLDFHGILKSGLISLFSGASKRIGFKKGFCKEMNFLFNNRYVDPGNPRLNRMEKNLCMISHLSCVQSLPETWLSPPGKIDEKINKFWRRIQPVNHPVIAVQPSSSEDTDFKRWFPERYAKLCDMLMERLGATIILTWGPGGEEAVEKIRNMMTFPAHIACPTTLMELSALFRKCDLYVGGDTGPMHLACFSELPAVVIYGPTDPLVNAPYPHSRHRIVRVDLPCSPCRDKTCKRLDCMKQITPTMVFDETVSLWDEITKKNTGEKTPFQMETAKPQIVRS